MLAGSHFQWHSESSAHASPMNMNNKRTSMLNRSGWPGGHTNTEKLSFCTTSRDAPWTRHSLVRNVTVTRFKRPVGSTSG